MIKTRSSATAEIARCGCRSPRPIILHPLNSPMSVKFAYRTTYLSVLAINASPSLQLHVYTPPHFQVEMEKTAGSIGGRAFNLLWCQGAQNIELSNRKLKSALKCNDHNARPSHTDRQRDRRTDKHNGNSATIRSNERIARWWAGLLPPPMRRRISRVSLSVSVCMSVMFGLKLLKALT